MGIDERYQYLRRMQARYQQADRKRRSQMLDAMIIYTGMHRKALIRRLGSDLTRKPRLRERGRTYGPDVDAALRVIWEALDYVCALRLQPNLVSTGKLLARHDELQWTPHLETLLQEISVATVRRHLPPPPHTHRRRRPRTPQNQYQQKIPAYRIPRDIPDPGHLELDLVHHCGAATLGNYVHTLQLVDVASGWSCRRAILGRSRLAVTDALAFLIPRLPFALRELHPDNGSEFLNEMVLAFLAQDYPDAVPSRCRPARPNDNRLVEEKNGSLIRHYLGDRRLDTVIQTRFLNALYERIETFHNLILPVIKQIDKVWVPATADRPGYLRRFHDTPRPPLDRLCAILGEDCAPCRDLLKQRLDTNPLQPHRAIYRDLDHLFAYPLAVPGHVESTFETLVDPDRFPQAVVALKAVNTVDKPHDGFPTVPTVSTTTTDVPSSGRE
jgi:hypothetical protein